jgi:hypothetical protein
LSHLNERSQKNCLNCNAQVHGKYCHICGQENIEPFETAWHLVSHFFKDITHFDGKFFSTLKYLIFKPGFLSKEYMIGRRASYLNPIRMYVFTSAIFFLIFFSLTDVNDKIVKRTYDGKTMEQVAAMDSAAFNAFIREFNDGKTMTMEDFKHYVDSSGKTGGIHFTPRRYKNKAEYDSVLKTGKKDHNWLQRTLVYKEIQVNEKYNNDQSLILKSFVNILVHSFPQMLFISLPLFALILKLLYIRRKEYYYASHEIFSVHLYVFIFIMLLVVIGLREAKHYLHWGAINYIVGLVFASIVFYEYKAMRNFYEQRRAKTILKFILLNTLMLSIVVLLFAVFTFLSLLKI